MYRCRAFDFQSREYVQSVIDHVNRSPNIESAPYSRTTQIRIAASEPFVLGTTIILHTLLRGCDESQTTLVILRWLNIICHIVQGRYILPEWIRKRCHVSHMHQHLANAIELSTLSPYMYQSLSDSNIDLHPSLVFGIPEWWEMSELYHLRFVSISGHDIPDLISNFRLSNPGDVNDEITRISKLRKVCERYYPQIHSTIMNAFSVRMLLGSIFRRSISDLLKKLYNQNRYSWILAYWYPKP